MSAPDACQASSELAETCRFKVEGAELGLTDAEGETDGDWLIDALGLTEGDCEREAEGLTDAEGETDGDWLIDALGLTEALGDTDALPAGVAYSG